MRTLDIETLKRIGFRDVGKDSIGRSSWRIKVPYYHFEIQIALGSYPASNPNSGVVSLYDEGGEALGFDKLGRRRKIKLKERLIPIAWYVTTPERLHAIISSLTAESF